MKSICATVILCTAFIVAASARDDRGFCFAILTLATLMSLSLFGSEIKKNDETRNPK